MIENIVRRAKKLAIKRVIGGGDWGVRMDDLLASIKQEYKEHEDLPNTTNPDDWAKISGKKGERIVFIRTLVNEGTRIRWAAPAIERGRHRPVPVEASRRLCDDGSPGDVHRTNARVATSPGETPRARRAVVERGEVGLDLGVGHPPGEVQADPAPLDEAVASAHISIEVRARPVEAEAVALEVHLHVRIGEVESHGELAVAYPVLADRRREAACA